MNLQEKFISQLKQFSFIQRKQKQLLAVSGGVDSVVLCDLVFTAEYDFVIAHCNFQLRGDESERDEQFVRSLGEKYGKEVLVKRFDTEKYAAENKVSIQVAARELRYEWFREMLTMNNEQSTMNNGESAMNNEQSSMNNGQSTMNNEQSTMNNEQSTMNNEQSTMNNEQSTMNNEQSTMNNEQSTMNNEQSTMNNELPDSQLSPDISQLSPDISQLSPDNSHLTTHNSQFTAHYILTAHHANDNIETVLMNFFKGTGISGLHGILPVQGKVVRPLLFAKKDELIAYATENNLPFVEDSSNRTDKYTRNFFRHHLFPMLKEIYPNVENNILNNIQRLTEAEELYAQSVASYKKKLLEYKGNEIHIPILKLQKCSPLATIIYEIIKDFGFTATRVKEVVDLLGSETGKYVSSSTHRVIKNRNWLIISPAQTMEAANILIEKTDRKVMFSGGEITLDVADIENFKVSASNFTAVLDKATVTFPLLLRKWKQGDYFYPLGMKKKKKLSRFFIDQKLSKTDKENIWILEMNKKIIWILGQRIDDRFKIQPSTTQILKISFEPL